MACLLDFLVLIMLRFQLPNFRIMSLGQSLRQSIRASKTVAAFTSGDKVEARFNGDWFSATILSSAFDQGIGILHVFDSL
jgi:hypothetical protein